MAFGARGPMCCSMQEPLVRCPCPAPGWGELDLAVMGAPCVARRAQRRAGLRLALAHLVGGSQVVEGGRGGEGRRDEMRKGVFVAGMSANISYEVD